VLAHETTHIAKNHALFSNAFLPLSLVLSNVAIRKIPNKLFAGLVGIAVILGGNTLLSWRLEHDTPTAQVAHPPPAARRRQQCAVRLLLAKTITAATNSACNNFKNLMYSSCPIATPTMMKTSLPSFHCSNP
jgi:hypothetical protein